MHFKEEGDVIFQDTKTFLLVPDDLDSGVYNPEEEKSSPAVKKASIFFLLFCYQHIVYFYIFRVDVPQVQSFYLLGPRTLLQYSQPDFKVYRCLLREIPYIL